MGGLHCQCVPVFRHPIMMLFLPGDTFAETAAVALDPAYENPEINQVYIQRDINNLACFY